MTDELSPLELEGLWDEFHRVVNMSSPELSEWLRVNSANENTEAVPEETGPMTGRQVLAILQKRRMDLNGEDIRVMYEVVDTVGRELEQREEQGRDEPTAGDSDWRHRLMSLGHDPLKP